MGSTGTTKQTFKLGFERRSLSIWSLPLHFPFPHDPGALGLLIQFLMIENAETFHAGTS